MPAHLYDDEMKAILLEAAKVIRQIEACVRTQSGAVRYVTAPWAIIGRVTQRAVVCFCSS